MERRFHGYLFPLHLHPVRHRHPVRHQSNKPHTWQTHAYPSAPSRLYLLPSHPIPSHPLPHLICFRVLKRDGPTGNQPSKQAKKSKLDFDLYFPFQIPLCGYPSQRRELYDLRYHIYSASDTQAAATYAYLSATCPPQELAQRKHGCLLVTLLRILDGMKCKGSKEGPLRSASACMQP